MKILPIIAKLPNTKKKASFKVLGKYVSAKQESLILRLLRIDVFRELNVELFDDMFADLSPFPFDQMIVFVCAQTRTEADYWYTNGNLNLATNTFTVVLLQESARIVLRSLQLYSQSLNVTKIKWNLNTPY